MTLEEFNRDVVDLWDLISFCNENGYDEWTYDIVSSDNIDDHIDERVSEMMNNRDGWEAIRDFLTDIPEGYDWYNTSEWEIAVFDEADEREFRENLIERLLEDEFFEVEDDEEDEETDTSERVVRFAEFDEVSGEEDECIKEDISINEMIFASLAP